jgi:hypothetical protein
MHTVADVHATPFRPMLNGLPEYAAGLGVLWIAQLDPFQRSASIAESWFSLASVKKYDPIAVHAVAVVHTTPVSGAPCAPAGLGVLWIDQVLPSQRSAKDAEEGRPAPTAVHAVVEVHDTLRSPVTSRPPGPRTTGLGVLWIVQLVPFQTSASVSPAPVPPTASQAVANVHDTPLSAAPTLPTGFAVLWIVQPLPFQTSANVRPAASPTASQAVADVHDTPLNPLSATPGGFGTLWIVQLLPFHVSAKLSWCLALTYDPTAVQAVVDGHETPFSWLALAPAGLGVSWTDQLAPSQRSARLTCVPALLVDAPTAVQAVADVHETPFSWLDAPPSGLGVLRIDQRDPFQPSPKVAEAPLVMTV